MNKKQRLFEEILQIRREPAFNPGSLDIARHFKITVKSGLWGIVGSMKVQSYHCKGRR